MTDTPTPAEPSIEEVLLDQHEGLKKLQEDEEETPEDENS